MSDSYLGKTGYLVFELAMGYRSQIEEAMNQIGTSRSHGVIICEVGANHGISQTELADKLKVRTASMTYIIKQLEELGWIYRERDMDDQRVVRVYLTEAGKAIEPKIVDVWNHLEAVILAGLSDAQQADLRLLISHMLRNIQQAAAE